ANQDAGVDVAIERQHSDRTAIPSAGALFEIFDGHRGSLLGRADHGHRPHMAEESVQRIEAFLEKTFYVIDGVEQARISFDQAASDHLDGARFADARLIVA